MWPKFSMQPPVGDRSWLCRFAYLNGKSCSAVDPKLLSSYGQQRNFPQWPAIWKLSWILGFSEGGAEQLEVAHGLLIEERQAACFG